MALCASLTAVNGLNGIACVLAGLGSSVVSGTLSTTFNQCFRGCSSKSLGPKPPSTVAVKQGGNVYPTLTQQQLDTMRQRRLNSNCAPEQFFLHKEPEAHQAKHIMMCSGASCKTSCKGCNSGTGNGQRCWEYLSHRLTEINQLRSEEDDQDPILVSRLNCLQAQNLLPALAATLPCHGPIAVVYPEGVWYDRLTPLVLERIIEEHLLGGHTVTSHVMMGSRAPDHDAHVLPALDITRRANPDGHWACHYAY